MLYFILFNTKWLSNLFNLTDTGIFWPRQQLFNSNQRILLGLRVLTPSAKRSKSAAHVALILLTLAALKSCHRNPHWYLLLILLFAHQLMRNSIHKSYWKITWIQQSSRFLEIIREALRGIATGKLIHRIFSDVLLLKTFNSKKLISLG